MAEFTRTPQETTTPVYVDSSRGIRSSPNTAVGDLFTNLSRTLVTGVEKYDEIQLDNIYDQVVAADEEFGNEMLESQLEAARVASQVTQSDLPPELRRGQQRINGLQNAYQRGAMSESHYWARMNAMTKELRARYPRYRREIDGIVSSVTGARPANALRRELMQIASSSLGGGGGGSNQQKRFERLIDNNLEYLPPDYYTRMENGNPYSFVELQAHVARKQQVATEMANRKAELELEAAQGNITEDRAVQTFRQETSQAVFEFLQDTNTALGQSFAEVQREITRAQQMMREGQQLPQTELEQLRGNIGQLKTQIRLRLTEEFVSPWSDGSTESYSKYIDRKDMEDIIDQAMTPITILEEALMSDNPWGVLGATNAWLEASKSQSQRQLLEQIPMAGRLSAMQEMLGADVTGLYLRLNPQLQRAVESHLLNYASIEAATNNGQATIDKSINRARQTGAGGEYVNAEITRWTNLVDGLADGSMANPSIITGNINYMFGSRDVMSLLDVDSQLTYFSKVTSPRVTQTMLDLRKQGFEEEYETYAGWVEAEFIRLFREKVEQVQNLSTDPGFEGGIEWDGKRFRMARGFEPTDVLFPGSMIAQTMNENRTGRAIQEINTAIASIIPVIEAEGGDVAQELALILETMGYDPNAPVQEGFMAMLYNSLVGMIMDIDEGL